LAVGRGVEALKRSERPSVVDRCGADRGAEEIERQSVVDKRGADKGTEKKERQSVVKKREVDDRVWKIMRNH